MPAAMQALAEVLLEPSRTETLSPTRQCSWPTQIKIIMLWHPPKAATGRPVTGCSTVASAGRRRRHSGSTRACQPGQPGRPGLLRHPPTQSNALPALCRLWASTWRASPTTRAAGGCCSLAPNAGVRFSRGYEEGCRGIQRLDSCDVALFCLFFLLVTHPSCTSHGCPFPAAQDVPGCHEDWAPVVCSGEQQAAPMTGRLSGSLSGSALVVPAGPPRLLATAPYWRWPRLLMPFMRQSFLFVFLAEPRIRLGQVRGVECHPNGG